MFVLNKRKRIEYRKNSKFLKVISLRTKRMEYEKTRELHNREVKRDSAKMRTELFNKDYIYIYI